MTVTAAPATDTTKPAGLAQVQKYFSAVDPAITDKDYNMAAFRADWAGLTDKDKTDLRKGLGDGTMTY
jgi:hypothetical protein